MLVRETAPAHQLTAVSPSGLRTRWAGDELDPSRVPSGLSWSTSIPGGADTLRCVLPRDPERAYPDLDLLSELQVVRDGGRTMRFRLEEVPRVSGDQMAVEPAAKGYRAVFEDQADVRVLFVDADISHWGNMSRARRITLITGSTSPFDPVATSDNASGIPCVLLEHTGSWLSTATPNGEANYQHDIPIAKITGTLQWQLAGGGGTWDAYVGVADDDIHTNREQTSDFLTGANSGTSTVSFTPTTARKVGLFRFYWNTASAGTGLDNAVFAAALRNPRVFGNHGLTATSDSFYTGQMLEWLVTDRTALDIGTVDDGTFLNPHAAFLDPTTTLSIIENLTRYEPLYDWYVYDDFNFRRRGTYGRRWRTRVAASGLRSTGQTLDRLFNQIAVRVQDPFYGEQIVGPVGSGYSNTSADLSDSDPDNPANQVGIGRRALLDIGEGTIAGAIEVGRRFLEESKRLDNSGQCTLTGYVEDEAGTYWPVDEVRAGDEISFSDSADTSWRHIAATDYNADSQTNSLSIDAPPQTMDGLLARLQAVLIPLG